MNSGKLEYCVSAQVWVRATSRREAEEIFVAALDQLAYPSVEDSPIRDFALEFEVSEGLWPSGNDASRP